MKLKIACVGRLKEAFYAAAQAEYVKRISRYAKTEIIEVAEEKCAGEAAALIAQVREEEGKRLLQAAKGYDYRIALSPEGVKKDSLKFAADLNELAARGVQGVCFFIGGSWGLSADLKAQCQEVLSFSDMTFAHQLFRILLLEQLYRAFKINANETYHK